MANITFIAATIFLMAKKLTTPTNNTNNLQKIYTDILRTMNTEVSAIRKMMKIYSLFKNILAFTETEHTFTKVVALSKFGMYPKKTVKYS